MADSAMWHMERSPARIVKHEKSARMASQETVSGKSTPLRETNTPPQPQQHPARHIPRIHICI